MGNEQSGKYVVKYPPEFNELHLKVDNGLTFFKDELSSAARSGRATSGIKERAQTRKKLKEWEHELNKMEKIKIDAMAEKKKWDERDFARWQEMLDGLKEVHLECKSLCDGNARTRSPKKEDTRATAEDFLRGDGANAAQVNRETSGGSLRTGKMSDQEKQAMKEINDKEDVMDDLVDQITENTEFLSMRAEMIGEEIEAQSSLVKEVDDRTKRVKDRTTELNKDIKKTMVEDGFEEDKKKKKKEKKGPQDIKSTMAKAALKSMLGGS